MTDDMNLFDILGIHDPDAQLEQPRKSGPQVSSVRAKVQGPPLQRQQEYKQPSRLPTLREFLTHRFRCFEEDDQEVSFTIDDRTAADSVSIFWRITATFPAAGA